MTLWGVIAIYGQTADPGLTVHVPATSNPYLAGMPPGTQARIGDVAPDQSPVLVETSLENASAVRFTAVGRVAHSPDNPPQFDPPSGSISTSHQGGAEHGISDITAPMNSLIGVFLSDERPDRSRAPKELILRNAGRDLDTVSPQLKQVFFIGAGITKKRVSRRFLVPKGATRLFLGVMDGFEWNNNLGAFRVVVTVERSSTDSQITFADWACLPDRSHCTPDKPIVKLLSPGHYRIVLPGHLEWGASVPTPAGTRAAVERARGTVCLDSESRSASSCTGAMGSGTRAGAGFLVEDAAAGALVTRVEGDRTFFSVNGRSGATFRKYEGFFEFDVYVK